MDNPTVSGQVISASKQLAKRLLTIGANRLELLTVEVQEERVRIMLAVLLVFGVAALGLLAGVTLTAAIVVILWAYSPAGVLLSLTGLYGLGAIGLYRRLTSLLREWRTLSATLDQLRKDRACLENILS
jgi:uncharacterized membrane protein YqjE